MKKNATKAEIYSEETIVYKPAEAPAPAPSPAPEPSPEPAPKPEPEKEKEEDKKEKSIEWRAVLIGGIPAVLIVDPVMEAVSDKISDKILDLIDDIESVEKVGAGAEAGAAVAMKQEDTGDLENPEGAEEGGLEESEGVSDADNPQAEDPHPGHESHYGVPSATTVNDGMSFREAFAAARGELGPGGVFEWRGHHFNTYLQSEWNGMSSAEKNEFLHQVYDPQPEPEDVLPETDSTDVEVVVETDSAEASDAGENAAEEVSNDPGEEVSGIEENEAVEVVVEEEGFVEGEIDPQDMDPGLMDDDLGFLDDNPGFLDDSGDLGDFTDDGGAW